MAAGDNQGFLPNGWPLAPGLDPRSANITTPTATQLGSLSFFWTVPSGKWWQPLFCQVQQQCLAVGNSPTNYCVFAVNSAYFGTSNATGSNGFTQEIGLTALNTQRCVFNFGVGLSQETMTATLASIPIQGSVAIPPMLAGPKDTVQITANDFGTVTPNFVWLICAEYDSAGGDQGNPSDVPLLPTPILA